MFTSLRLLNDQNLKVLKIAVYEYMATIHEVEYYKAICAEFNRRWWLN